MKQYPPELTHRVAHLQKIFGTIEAGEVPNVAHATEFDDKRGYVVFDPSVSATHPITHLELLAALRDVFAALVVPHGLGIVHRDIR